MNNELAERIVKKAGEIGYYKCGIIPIEEALSGYEERLDERYERFPDDRKYKAEGNYGLAHPERDYPWVRSVIIAAVALGEYQMPEGFEGRIGRIFAFDYRHQTNAREHGWEAEMADFLKENGIRAAHSPDRGIVPLRYVAMKAGIGIIRRNNFLYAGDQGSFVALSAWITDQPMRLVHDCDLKPCPGGCRRCMDACPTKSLEAPFAMHRRTCVSPLTTKFPEGEDITRDDIGLHFEGWLYGCDACQNACPFNQKILKKAPTRTFPDQDRYEPYMDPEKILSLTDDFLEERFQPRFWYMPPGTAWKWKANAMCALIHEKHPRAKQLIEPYAHHENESLKKVAKWSLEQICQP